MGLIRLIIEIYIYVLLADAVLSFLPQFKSHQAAVAVRKLSDLICKPIRKLLPSDMSSRFPFDFSPLIAIVVLRLFVALF